MENTITAGPLLQGNLENLTKDGMSDRLRKGESFTWQRKSAGTAATL